MTDRIVLWSPPTGLPGIAFDTAARWGLRACAPGVCVAAQIQAGVAQW